MIMKVLVGSQAQAQVVEVEGNGLTPIEAQRQAVNLARGLYHFPDPVALVDNHKSAKIVRNAVDRMFEELKARIRQDLIRRRSPMCFDDRYEPAQFD